MSIIRVERSVMGRLLAGFTILVFLVALAVTACAPVAPSAVNVNLSEAVGLSKNGNISKAIIDNGAGVMTMTAVVTDQPLQIPDVDGVVRTVTTGTVLITNIGTLSIADLKTIGFVLPADYTTASTSSASGWSTLLFLIVPLALIFVFIMIMSRRTGGAQNQVMAFARSRARLNTGDRPKVTFADVAGVEEAKEDLREVVEFLKNRWKFQALGAVIPKGALLVGPPGTGKTLLARAVAGEAGVPFFSVSGSEFVEIFVGVGAARVRDLFQQAKQNAPCIVFIDEIDAVGRQRSGAMPGSHEEREQTLNQILVEMDGFDPNSGVIVLAATNRVDVLDPALLRPGRFDRRVMLDLPDTAGRRAILEIHTKGKPVEPGMDLDVLAKETHGFSGADLANVVNEAAILAVRRNKKSIGLSEFGEAVDRVIAGPERKSRRINPRDRELTAFHEGGHALVAHSLPNVDPVRKISIVARGSMGGYTRLLTEDRYFMTASQFRETLATLLAGHASEEMIFGEISTGPHSDIQQATAMARRMITDFGMSEKLGLRTFGVQTTAGYLGLAPPEQRDYSEDVAKQIDDEVFTLMAEAREVSRKIVHENRPRLVHIAQRLLDKEVLEGPELEAVFNEPLNDSDYKWDAHTNNHSAAAVDAKGAEVKAS